MCVSECVSAGGRGEQPTCIRVITVSAGPRWRQENKQRVRVRQSGRGRKRRWGRPGLEEETDEWVGARRPGWGGKWGQGALRLAEAESQGGDLLPFQNDHYTEKKGRIQTSKLYFLLQGYTGTFRRFCQGQRGIQVLSHGRE